MKMVQHTLVVLLAAFCTVHGLGYDFHDFISTGICPTRRNMLLETFLSQRKEVRILSDTQRGAIYEQTWNSSSFKRYNECKFTLRTPPGSGLYLIIRKLNLRRDARGNCIDTVTVKQSNNEKTRFCFTPTDVPRSFSDESHVKITVKLDNYVPLPGEDDTLQIQLVATPKMPCPVGSRMLKCEMYDYQSCIDQSFYRDGTINCPNCSDEDGCSMELEKVNVASNQNIILTAIVSLTLTMLVCCAGIWCLYQNRRCVSSCSSNSSAGSLTDSDTGGRRIRTRGRRNISSGVLSVELPDSSTDLRPSAPRLDLPPSYDALFPVAPDGSTMFGPTTVSIGTSPTIPKSEVDRELHTTK